jgi:hypothetical protein
MIISAGPSGRVFSDGAFAFRTSLSSVVREPSSRRKASLKLLAPEEALRAPEPDLVPLKYRPQFLLQVYMQQTDLVLSDCHNVVRFRQIEEGPYNIQQCSLFQLAIGRIPQ